MNTKENCCFSKLLKVIDILQKNSCGELCNDESCTRPFLGGSPTIICYNTRPVTFYTASGNIFTANYQVAGNNKTSSVFRVENVDDCCATLRILRPTGEDDTTYTATNEFVTVNLECFCILRCLNDTYLEI